MHLRPYQTAALQAVREAYRQGHRAALVVMPTGTGKTVLFAEISRLAKGPVLVIAHRQELVEQARAKIAAWCNDVVAVEMAHRRDFTRPDGSRPKIAVASIQTLQKRLREVPREAFRIVVVDEAHHATADSYRAVLAHFDAHLLGVTATPDRSDRVPLGELFSTVAFEYDMRRAIADGWLCPIRSFLVQTQADFSAVRKVAGELRTRDVEDILTQELHLAEIAAPILRERGNRPTIVFAASVLHAHALARVLNERAGCLVAAAVDGATPFEARAPVLDRFRRGELPILVNCALFTEGFDVPEIALVAIARPVLSRSFYAQMVGRGTRIAKGKTDLLVLDFVPSNCRHTLAQAVDIFASADPEVQERARRIAAEASAEGQAIALEKALELAQQEQEALAATVAYQLKQRDPFAAVGIDLAAYVRRSRSGGERASAGQLEYFRKAGLPVDAVAQLSSQAAESLREALLERKAVGLCTPKQAKQLVQLGVDPRNLYYDEAQRLLREKRGRARTDAEDVEPAD